jgi:hypothetical protein|tara:strand:- start:205 stop:348 length:144 start_codon:yes stop_codon:yes gene_type:complete
MKKRKLNSTNPKYYPQPEESKDTRELIATIPFGKKRKVYAYAVFNEK